MKDMQSRNSAEASVQVSTQDELGHSERSMLLESKEGISGTFDKYSYLQTFL